jgi:hypothetical protein
MNIIFIDIDGPLSFNQPRNEVIIEKGNSEFKIPYSWNIEDCKALNTMVENTNSKLVLSSDWRFKYSFLQIKKIFDYYFINPNHLIDFTTLKFGLSYNISTEDRIKLRSQEILLYVEANIPEKWLAIDDLNLDIYFKEKNYTNNHLQVDGFWVKDAGYLRDKINLVIDLFNI